LLKPECGASILRTAFTGNEKRFAQPCRQFAGNVSNIELWLAVERAMLTGVGELALLSAGAQLAPAHRQEHHMPEAYARIEPSFIPIPRPPDVPGSHDADQH
jgi:hypothetical protein